MKKLTWLFSIIVVAFLMSSNLQGQTYQQEVMVFVNGVDYGAPIGVVTGTYVYKFSFRLDKSGNLESLHWNVLSSELVNDAGNKVLIIDSGHDTHGEMWDLWNNIGAFNEGWNIVYKVDDGWLDEILPAVYPEEGTCAKMSTKVLYRGTTFSLAGLLQIHMNANGDITAEVRKGWFE